jgi:hypothetical protein
MAHRSARSAAISAAIPACARVMRADRSRGTASGSTVSVDSAMCAGGGVRSSGEAGSSESAASPACSLVDYLDAVADRMLFNRIDVVDPPYVPP